VIISDSLLFTLESEAGTKVSGPAWPVCSILLMPGRERCLPVAWDVGAPLCSSRPGAKMSPGQAVTERLSGSVPVEAWRGT